MLTNWVVLILLPGFILLLPVFLKVLPWYHSWDSITFYDWQRVLVISIFSLISTFSVCKTELVLRIFGKRVLFSFFFVVAIGVLSIISNRVPWHDGIREVVNLGLMCTSVFGLVVAMRRAGEEKWLKIFVFLIVGSGVFYSLVFYGENWLKFFSPEWMDVSLYFPSFSNVRFFSDYQAFIYPFFLCYVAKVKGRGRFFAWLILASFLALSILSGGRSFLLGQIVSFVVLMFFARESFIGYVKPYFISWLGAIVFFLLISMVSHYALNAETSALSEMDNQLARSGLSYRDILWSIAWSDVKSNPILGIGPGEFSRQENPVAAGPHSSFLMLAAEWGGVVFTIFSIGLGCFFYTLFRLRSISSGCVPNVTAREEGYWVAACWAFISLLAQCTVANLMGIPTSQACLVLSISILFAIGVKRSEVELKKTCLWNKLYVGIVLFLVFSAINVLSIDVPNLPERNRAFLACRKPTFDFSPRFWQQGWLVEPCRVD